MECAPGCGKAAGLKPAGLGARDLLRLDMAYLLYGNDISEDITPMEAAAEWVVDFGKGDFVGRDVLYRQKANGLEKRLVAFELVQKAVPRHGFKIQSDASSGQREIGEVTQRNLARSSPKGDWHGLRSAAQRDDRHIHPDPYSRPIPSSGHYQATIL